MPTSSSAYSLDKKRLLKCKKKSLTPNSQPKKSQPLVQNVSQIKRSHSSLSITNKCVNNEPLILKTYPDGAVHISRTPEEKQKNPDRICLDRRALTLVPILDNEQNLRLLSLQHNLITSLENLVKQSYPILVFLDVYDNQIEAINFLEHLTSLRVLLLGKNRIKKIEGLVTLSNLEVLDLHGNQISVVNGLEQCESLKVLNLAGNQIRNIGAQDLEGLKNLQELNLRRNRLRRLIGFNETPNLYKLFLSNNELQSVEDIHNIAKTTSIREITIDNNPVFQNGDCVSFLISYLPKLSNLNTMLVNDQARKSAMAWRRNKESSNELFKDLSQNISFNGRREEVISNARTNWELLRTQTKYVATSSKIEKTATIKPDSDFITTKLVKREKTLRNTRTGLNILPDKRTFVPRTNSMETDSSSNQSDQFRLPPILVPIINKLETGSTSSIGPNVDSSISSLISSNLSHSEEESSDDDLLPEAEIQPDQVQVNEVPVINEEQVKCEEIKAVAVENVETLSNLSSNTTSSNNGSNTSDNSTKRQTRLRRAVKSAMNTSNKVSIRANRAITAKVQSKRNIVNENSTIPTVALSREREQGGDYLIEICGRHLNVYGHGALRFLDKAWCQNKANDVHTVNFNYANFNGICSVLNKVKVRFPNAEHFIFKETNIYCLGQLNAMAEIQGLSSLNILPEGNPIIDKEWQEYAIFRLAHWGLKVLNGKEISDEDLTSANASYESLNDLVLWSLPNETLQPLLTRMRIDVTANEDLTNPKHWLMQADPALRNVVSKEALQWKKTTSSVHEDIIMRQKARIHISGLLNEFCNTIKKAQLFEKRWPSILQEIVRNTLIDYSQIDIYTKRQLLELMKSCNS